LGIVLLFILLPASAVGDNAATREQVLLHLTRADASYHAFDNRNAMSEYKAAYRLAPDSFATLQRITLIYNDMGRILLHSDTSAVSYNHTSLAYAESPSVYYPQRAESHFWVALNEGSLIPFAGTREKIVRARRVLEEANRTLALDSTFSPAYVILGIFQRETSHIGWFERVIARVVFGAEVGGTLSDSERMLRAALRFNPSNPYAYYELFWTYKALHDTSKARQALEGLLSLPPTDEREREQLEEAKKVSTAFFKKP
jgi:tetratricopeptide (TPR) repeat protein